MPASAGVICNTRIAISAWPNGPQKAKNITDAIEITAPTTSRTASLFPVSTNQPQVADITVQDATYGHGDKNQYQRTNPAP